MKHRGVRKVEFKKAKKPSGKKYDLPFVVIVDTAEKMPWTFTGFEADKDQGGGRIIVPRRREHLETGDYSIQGFEETLTVERKSFSDLIGTLAGGRARFEREHERMRAMGPGNAVVMVEGSWSDVFSSDWDSGLLPKTVHRTALSWFNKYGVPWFFFGTRRLAEESCLRYLQLWYRHESEERRSREVVGDVGGDRPAGS